MKTLPFFLLFFLGVAAAQAGGNPYTEGNRLSGILMGNGIVPLSERLDIRLQPGTQKADFDLSYEVQVPEATDARFLLIENEGLRFSVDGKPVATRSFVYNAENGASAKPYFLQHPAFFDDSAAEGYSRMIFPDLLQQATLPLSAGRHRIQVHYVAREWQDARETPAQQYYRYYFRKSQAPKQFEVHLSAPPSGDMLTANLGEAVYDAATRTKSWQFAGYPEKEFLQINRYALAVKKEATTWEIIKAYAKSHPFKVFGGLFLLLSFLLLLFRKKQPSGRPPKS